MTTATHTPGPWRVVPGMGQIEARNPHFDRWDVIATCHGFPNEGEAEANAALISSAPNLLAERDRLRAEKAELVKVLEQADALRPALLNQLHYVPECVLFFCNQARAILRDLGES